MKKILLSLSIILLIPLIFNVIGCNSSDTFATTESVAGYVTDTRIEDQPELEYLGQLRDFEFVMPDGEKLKLSDLSGKNVLLNFWYIDCPYCVYEMPFLQIIREEFGEDELVILGINTADSETRIAQFVEENGITFPIISDLSRYSSSLYEVRYFPSTYIIDKNGIIKYRKIGAFIDTVEIFGALDEVDWE